MLASQDSINGFIRDCLEEELIEGIQKHGLDPQISPGRIEQEIVANLPVYLNDFEQFKNQGFKITNEDINAHVVINDDRVVVDLIFPTIFERSDGTFAFQNTTYIFERTAYKPLDSSQETVVVSTDNSMVLKIPSGTEAFLDGSQIEEVGIKIHDKHYMGLSNAVVPGQLTYEFLPDGAVFTKKINVIYYYNNEYFSYPRQEENLKFSYYGPYFDIWWALPTDVDADQDILRAQMMHFSGGTSTDCPSMYQTIQTGILAQHDCEDCGANWQYPKPDTCKGPIGNCWTTDKGVSSGHGKGKKTPKCTVGVLKNSKADFPPGCSLRNCGEVECHVGGSTRMVYKEEGVCSNPDCDCLGYDYECTFSYYDNDCPSLKATSDPYELQLVTSGGSCGEVTDHFSGTEFHPLSFDPEGSLELTGAENTIMIEPISPTGDSCEVKKGSLSGGGLVTFTLEVTNSQSNDACYSCYAIIKIMGKGVGINAEYGCNPNQDDSAILDGVCHVR